MLGNVRRHKNPLSIAWKNTASGYPAIIHMKDEKPLLNTRWLLSALPGQHELRIPAELPWIQFLDAGETFRGVGGSNTMTGKFITEGNELRIEYLAMTRNFTEFNTMKVEGALAKAISETDNFLISGELLELRKGSQVLVVLRAGEF